MSIELPPLRPSTYGQATTKSEPQPRTYTAKSVEARERILTERIAELEKDAERHKIIRNKNKTRVRCYHFAVSLAELALAGNEQAAKAFGGVAPILRHPHVNQKMVQDGARAASGGEFGNCWCPYEDAARGKV